MASLVPVALPHGALALALVLPSPVGLLTVLAAVGSVPATPVDGLSLALVTLKLFQNVIKTNKFEDPGAATSVNHVDHERHC